MPTAAVHSLLSLLSEVDFGAPAACGEAVGPSPGVQTDQDELAAFSMGPALKRQLVAARAERLARFLRLQLAAGGSLASTPRSSRSSDDGGATPRPSGSATPNSVLGGAAKLPRRTARQRLSEGDSAEELDGPARCKAHWSPGETQHLTV